MQMDKKLQWHPAFCSAVRLDLRADKNVLLYKNEYNLNTKPLQVDLLVIKKAPETVIGNPVGKIFREHNILEYKSPEDAVDADTFYKTVAYACLYKAGGAEDEVPASEVTISIVRDAKPRELLKELKKMGNKVTEPYPGIYYITGSTLFPMQVVFTQALDPVQNRWLRSLTQKMDKTFARDLLEASNSLTEKREKELADSVLEVAVGANREVFKEAGRDEAVCEALMEIMQPIMDARIESIVQARVEELAQTRVEELARARAEELARTRAEELAQTRAEELARTRAEELARARAEELAQTRAEELARTRVEELAQTRVEELAQTRVEELAQARAEELAQTKAEELAQTEKTAREAAVIGTARELGASEDKIGEILKVHLHYNEEQIREAVRKYDVRKNAV